MQAPNNLRLALFLRNWTGRRLAQRMGLTESAISRIAHGNRGTTFENRRKIARILNVSPAWLWSEPTGPPTANLKLRLPLGNGKGSIPSPESSPEG
jgi:transcriptional regulator with XRE-family HTH domain